MNNEKFYKMKRVNELDPYGEENWDDDGILKYDIENFDANYPNQKILILKLEDLECRVNIDNIFDFISYNRYNFNQIRRCQLPISFNNFQDANNFLDILNRYNKSQYMKIEVCDVEGHVIELMKFYGIILSHYRVDERANITIIFDYCERIFM